MPCSPDCVREAVLLSMMAPLGMTPLGIGGGCSVGVVTGAVSGVDWPVGSRLTLPMRYGLEASGLDSAIIVAAVAAVAAVARFCRLN